MEFKTTYTAIEWKEREDFYLRELTALKMVTVGQTKDDLIKRLSALDVLSTGATFDFMQAERRLEKVQMDQKNAELELFNTVKVEQLTLGNKITENDIKSMVKKHLMTNVMDGYNAPIFSVLSIIMSRHSFMKAVVEDVKNKRSSIISSLSLLKLESSLSPATDDSGVL